MLTHSKYAMDPVLENLCDAVDDFSVIIELMRSFRDAMPRRSVEAELLSDRCHELTMAMSDAACAVHARYAELNW